MGIVTTHYRPKRAPRKSGRAVAARVFSYEITATGPVGFQVSVTHPIHGTHLIGNFRSLLTAQMFVAYMREIDAGPSHNAAGYRIETLIRRNHQLIAAASEAWSEIKATKLKAGYARARSEAMNVRWQERLNAKPDHPLAIFRKIMRQAAGDS